MRSRPDRVDSETTSHPRALKRPTAKIRPVAARSKRRRQPPDSRAPVDAMAAHATDAVVAAASARGDDAAGKGVDADADATTTAPSPNPPPPPKTTTSAHGAIRAIAPDAVHRICSGQVVLDLASAVKELVENALDAGATNVEVRVREHGVECVEVVDNGAGVSEENFAALTTKYATSKIAAFDDLASLRSFGFRGEALSSLCAMSTLVVTTKTKDDDAGSRIEYDRSGMIVRVETVARATGTTVTLRDVFAPLPVRRKEFVRNAKREYAKLLRLLQAYAMISAGVRIVCSHQRAEGVRGGGNGGGRETVVNTRGGVHADVRSNVACVFGAKAVQGLTPVDAVLGADLGCRVVGLVSKAQAECGRAGGDRQFFYVNGRPVDLPKATKALNETYRAQFSVAITRAPFAVLDFRLPTNAYDVNVTPDKREVLLHSEKEIMAELRRVLLRLVSIRPRRRGERRYLRTSSPGASLRPPLAFNPDTPRRISTPLLTPFNSTPISSLCMERPSEPRWSGRGLRPSTRTRSAAGRASSGTAASAAWRRRRRRRRAAA